MLNLFQHLTASLYLPPLLGEILKQVQDDVIVSDERGTYNDERKSSERRGFVTRNGKRLEDVDLNSRGLLSPRLYDGIHI